MVPPGAQCWRDSTKAAGELTAQKRIAPRVNTSGRNESSQAKRREVREAADAGIDFAAREVREALDAEFFHRKAAENGTIHHRAAQRLRVHMPGARKIAHESPREGIARARGVVDFLERKCGNGKKELVVHHEGAVLAALDDQRARAHLE